MDGEPGQGGYRPIATGAEPPATVPRQPSSVQPLPGHVDRCIACPWEVRALYAASTNLVNAVKRALAGHGDPERVRHKLEELETEVERMRPIVEAHFTHR